MAPLNAVWMIGPNDCDYLFRVVVSGLARDRPKEARILLSELYRMIFSDADFNEIQPF